MASFRKRLGPNGHIVWQVRVARKGYPFQYDTFDTKSRCELWAREVEAEIDRGAKVLAARTAAIHQGQNSQRASVAALSGAT